MADGTLKSAEGTACLPVPSGTGRALAFALTAVLIWGIQLPIAKGALIAMDGYSVSLIRYAVAVLAFVPALLLLEGRRAFMVTDDRIGRVIVAGSFMGLSALFTLAGLERTRPEVAVLILGLQPAMTVIAEWIVWRRRPPAFTLVCLVTAFVGVLVAVTRGGTLLFATESPYRDETLGNVLVLIAAACWVTYVIISSRLHGWSSIRISALTCGPALATIVAGWMLALALGLVHVDMALVPGVWWRLVYVSLFGVVIAMFLWNGGALRIGAVNAMLLLNLMPVITFVFRAFEGATFAASEIVGGLIVVAALVANNLYLRRRVRLQAATG